MHVALALRPQMSGVPNMRSRLFEMTTKPPSSSCSAVREPSDSASAAADVLDRVGVRWALMGALAALRYRATARMTTDADLLVEPSPAVAEAFEREGYDVQVAGEDRSEPDMLLVRGKGDRIDIVFATVEYLKQALDRATTGVLTLEDVIIQKLIAWRPRDRDDIASILDAGHRFDARYIEDWAAAWEVEDRWAEAKRRAGIDDPAESS